jgi:ELWxxDGT repeat protein
MKTIRFSIVLICLLTITFRAVPQVVIVAEKTDSSLFSNLTVAGENLFFSSWSYGDSVEIWKTQGTLNSSVMIKKFMNYSGFSGQDPMWFTEFNNNLIFQGLESFSYNETGYPEFGTYLWKSDGTPEGTVKLKKLTTWFYLSDDFPETWGGQYIQLGDKLVFAATPSDSINPDYELWSTDGTPDGTVKITDINKKQINNPSDFEANSSFPTSLARIGSKLYFGANDGIHGHELWVSDGSEEGTHMVKDVYPGDTGSFGYYYHREEFVPSNNKLFFSAFYSRNLWVSDATETGTKEISDFQYPAKTRDMDMFLKDLTVVNGIVFFHVHYWNFIDPENDSIQLWKSDGTENGTIKVCSLNKMEVSSFNSYKSKLYFLNKNDALHELWRSDGTKNGTLKISEFKMPENSGSKLYVFNDSIYFTAFDASNILKIWKSDGTSEGTKPVENWDEPKITSISDLVLFKDGIYFAADHPDYGSAIFKYLNGPHVNTKVESPVVINNLAISPNPGMEYINIYLPGLNQNGIITVYDIKGSKTLCLNARSDQQMMKVDISKLKNGLYIVTFSGVSGKCNAKFVKE